MRLLTILLAGLASVFSCQFIHAQQTGSAKSNAVHPSAMECEKRFREGEISLGVPHEPGALKEVCQNVRESCRDVNAVEPDCERAKREMISNVTQSLKFRSPNGKRK